MQFKQPHHRYPKTSLLAYGVQWYGCLGRHPRTQRIFFRIVHFNQPHPRYPKTPLLAYREQRYGCLGRHPKMQRIFFGIVQFKLARWQRVARCGARCGRAFPFHLSTRHTGQEMQPHNTCRSRIKPLRAPPLTSLLSTCCVGEVLGDGDHDGENDHENGDELDLRDPCEWQPECCTGRIKHAPVQQEPPAGRDDKACGDGVLLQSRVRQGKGGPDSGVGFGLGSGSPS